MKQLRHVKSGFLFFQNFFGKQELLTNSFSLSELFPEKPIHSKDFLQSKLLWDHLEPIEITDCLSIHVFLLAALPPPSFHNLLYQM